MPDEDWWRALWPDPEQVIAMLGVRPKMEAVDLGCGDGLFTVPLASVSRHVIAIDIDQRMLAVTQAKLAAAGIANCGLVKGDAYDIAAFVNPPANFVLMANTFHGVPDKARLSRSVAAVLKAGGRFAAINWHRRPREETTVLGQPRGAKTDMRMEPRDVAAVVEPAGLKQSEVIELPPYHYVAIFEKPRD